MILQIILITLLFCVIGYAIGNILFAPIFVSLFHKEKIREKGSKNPGGANTTRIYGKKLGIVVILCDALKTYLVIIFSWIIYRYSIYQWNQSSELFCLIYLSGSFAILGHCFPIRYIYHCLFKNKFESEDKKQYSGGKGVSAAGGILFSISPYLGLIALAIWIVCIFLVKQVSISSMTTIFIASFLTFFPYINFIYLFNNSLLFQNEHFEIQLGNYSWFNYGLLIMLLFNSGIVIYRHKINIIQLIHNDKY